MRGVFLIALAVSASACAPRASGARTYFANNETCPVERVTVSDGPELTSRELGLRDSPPPKDVKEDPDRLEMWAQRHEEYWDARAATHLYEVSGCGVHREMACYRSGLATVCRTMP